MNCNQLILLTTIYRQLLPIKGMQRFKDDIDYLIKNQMITKAFTTADGEVINSIEGDMWNCTEKGANYIKQCLDIINKLDIEISDESSLLENLKNKNELFEEHYKAFKKLMEK